MGYKTQKEAWLKAHPKATAAEAWEAGYVQCTENWCRKERFGKFDRNKNADERTNLYENINKFTTNYSDKL